MISLLDEVGRKKSQPTILTEIGQEDQLFHDRDREAYAAIEVDGHTEVYMIRGQHYKELLQKRYFELVGHGANRNSVSDAISTLSAIAKFDGVCETVWLRYGVHDDAIAINLADKEWRSVIVSGKDWWISREAPERFIVKNGMAALPIPETSGSIDLLRDFLNLPDDGWCLLLGWLVSAMRPVGPYPVLVLTGEQGTAKSTASRVIRELIDPSIAPLRAPPKDEKDLLVSAVNSSVVCIDNLSHLPDWLSDALCRLATGGALSARALYTDHEEVLIDLQRPAILNGIGDLVHRPDLAERAVVLTLEPITEKQRIPESVFWKRFEGVRPYIYAALLDGLSCALRRNSEIQLDEQPRMADFATWATAAEPALGLDEGAFLRAYRGNQEDLAKVGIENAPVGRAVIAFMESRQQWEGRMSDLHGELQGMLEKMDKDALRSPAWPKNPGWLSNYITRLAPALRKVGVVIVKQRTAKGVVVSINKTEQE